MKAVAEVASHVIGLSDARQLGCGWNVLVDDGTLTLNQIAAIAPSAIVDQVSHLSTIWTFPAPPDAELEDDIAPDFGAALGSRSGVNALLGAVPSPHGTHGNQSIG